MLVLTEVWNPILHTLPEQRKREREKYRAGEVMLFTYTSRASHTLQTADEASVDLPDIAAFLQPIIELLYIVLR